MSNEGPKNPLEELERKVQELLKDPQVQASVRQMLAAAKPTPQPASTGPANPPPPADDDTAAALARIRSFNLRPREIRDHLDRFVIRQDDAKKILSVSICDHYNHVRQCLDNPELRERDYAKQNIILLGPTGVGKTYLMRCIAKLIGVPFVKADATKFSETGYVGGDVEDLVRDLVKAAGGDVELAQYGIIYIDEIDKIAAAANAVGGRDVSGRGVQINLLKLMEETDVSLHSQTDLLGQMQAMMEMQRGGKPRPRKINTRHILFIVSGAFDKLAEQIKRRVQTSSIGFGAARGLDRSESDYLAQVTSQDFITYGFEPEFVGRLPVRVACQSLATDDLERILTTSEGSILQQYRADFAGYGIDFQILPEALREVAVRAASENTGARGLMTVLERVFRDFKFELPSTAVKTFAIDSATVADPAAALHHLLRENADQQHDVLRAEVTAFATRFRQEHGFDLLFADDAVSALIDASLATDKTIRALCEEKFRDFHHGLKLVSRNTGRTQFPITRDVVEHPDKILSGWVVESFRVARATENLA
ncbi:MAG TPA: AAA family ATPase [Opitutaceae bacterium]|nr:AAA family ATPase [Opitutaceae bacterium]